MRASIARLRTTLRCRDALRRAGNARSRSVREREQLARCARAGRAREGARAGVRAHRSRDVDAGGRSRRARRSRRCRSRASPSLLELQKRAIARSADWPRRGWGGGARACSRRPARSTSPKARRPTTGGSRARCSPRAFAPATSCTTASPITSRRRARCSRPARTRSAARCFPAAPGQTEQQVAGDGRLAARRLRRHAVVPADHPRARPTSSACALPSLTKALRVRRSRSRRRCAMRCARAASTATRSMRTADLGAIAYETRGARRAGRRRRRAGRDRAARHRRSGRRRRSRRSRRDDARQRRLSADPLRHRRPVGGAARRVARAGAPTRASRAGWAAPTRRRRCKGMFVHPAQVADDRASGIPEIGARGSSSTIRDGNDRMTLHVEVAAPTRRSREAIVAVDPRRDEAARRGRRSAPPASCPTTAR